MPDHAFQDPTATPGSNPLPLHVIDKANRFAAELNALANLIALSGNDGSYGLSSILERISDDLNEIGDQPEATPQPLHLTVPLGTVPPGFEMIPVLMNKVDYQRLQAVAEKYFEGNSLVAANDLLGRALASWIAES